MFVISHPIIHQVYLLFVNIHKLKLLEVLILFAEGEAPLTMDEMVLIATAYQEREVSIDESKAGTEVEMEDDEDVELTDAVRGIGQGAGSASLGDVKDTDLEAEQEAGEFGLEAMVETEPGQEEGVVGCMPMEETELGHNLEGVGEVETKETEGGSTTSVFVDTREETTEQKEQTDKAGVEEENDAMEVKGAEEKLGNRRAFELLVGSERLDGKER